MTRCGQYGIAAVGVANSGHCGAVGVYTLPGLDAGYLTLVFSHGPAVMPAWGGSSPLLSTSPIAAGIPARPRPAIVDLATSAVARGKIAERAQRGEPLPSGWALDGSGQPTTDARAALAGLLSPLGGAKGFAVALVVEAMAAALPGPGLSVDVPDMFGDGDPSSPQRIGHMIITIDPARFDAQPGQARQRLDRLAAEVAGRGGRLPGARRLHPAELDDGAPLTVSAGTMRELAHWAGRLGVEIAAGRS